MAVVWEKIVRGKHYEVRTAGHSVRLYTDGVFHSQWNRQRPLAGHLWDLLFLPVFFHLSPDKIKDVLVLGVGGGTVINVFRHFFSACKVVGVDLDVTHLSIAKKYFLEDFENICLKNIDAVKFVREDNSKYDVIVEDLFLGSSKDKRDAVRPVQVDEQWLKTMTLRLKTKGLLVINFESISQLKKSLSRSRLHACGFQALYALSSPRYENAIAACIKVDVSKQQFSSQLAEAFQARSAREINQLNYSVKRII